MCPSVINSHSALTSPELMRLIKSIPTSRGCGFPILSPQGWRPSIPLKGEALGSTTAFVRTCFQQDFHNTRLLRESHRRGRFGQRKGARDERRWINFAGAEQRNGFGEGAAAGADDRDFFDHDGPGF